MTEYIEGFHDRHVDGTFGASMENEFWPETFKEEPIRKILEALDIAWPEDGS